MNKQEFIDVLINFKDAFNDLRNVLEQTEYDVSESYPFGESFDEISIDEWVDETIQKVKVEVKTERKQLFMKIIQMLEEREWEYDLINDRIEVEIGNEFWKVSKYDYIELKCLHDEIDNW